MDAQLKRGMLEGCVLAVLSRGDSYGYQLVKEVGAMRGDLGIHALSHPPQAGIAGESARLHARAQAGGCANTML